MEHCATYHWLKLRHANGLGSAGVQQLLQQFGSIENISSASWQALRSAGLPPECCDFIKSPETNQKITAELEWGKEPSNHIITFDSADYPKQLKNISQPPPVLYVRGNPNLLSEPQLAIVGSRNCTKSGEETALAFAEHLAKAGIIITSGLALGIDGFAHRGALNASSPTIAVMATGVNHIYPTRHQALAEQILEQGVLVSEMPLNTKPLAALFPQRNRIISGLSLGTLVIEATQRSGSLITARLAMEQAREVFAIPGSIHSPLARGCHQLIREGAKLVETTKDILEELAPQLQSSLAVDAPEEQSHHTETSSEYSALLQAIDYDPVSIDKIIQRSGLSAQEVSSMLLILELEGQVQNHPGGQYCRTK